MESLTDRILDLAAEYVLWSMAISATLFVVKMLLS